MMIELEKVLPPELFEKLNAEAARQNTPVTELLRDALAAYLEEDADEPEDSFEDTPDELILANFRQAWREAMNGEAIPADEAMERLRAKRAKNASDHS